MGSAACSVCPAGTSSIAGSSFCYRATGGVIEDRGLYVTHTFFQISGKNQNQSFTALAPLNIYDELVITATNVYSKGPRVQSQSTYVVNVNSQSNALTGLLRRGSVYTTDYGTFQSGTDQYVIVYLKTPCPASTPKWDPLQKKCVASCSPAISNVCTKCPTISQVSSIPDTSVKFNSPYGVAIDSGGNVYVADTGNNRIRKITPNGISTLAGSGTAGYLDGSGLSAQFRGPVSVAVDSSDNIYVSDSGNHRIRKITSAGVVTTLAGSGSALFLDGSGTNASFSRPGGIAVDSAGNVYVGDIDNHRVRKITSAGVVTTLAGSTTTGTADGSGSAAQFNQPAGIAVDSNGNIYVADILNNNIRKITSAGVVTTLAGSGTPGSADGQGTAAQFYYPCSVAVDSAGNVYVADPDNHKVRKITPSGTVTRLAGTSLGYSDGSGAVVKFNYPRAVAVDSAGNVYVADTSNNKIRKITPSGAVGTYDTSAMCEPGFTLSGTTCNGTSLTCPDQSWTLSSSLCTKTELRCPTGSILMPQNYCLFFSNNVSTLQTSVDLVQSATSTPVSKPAYGACVTDCPVNSYKSEDCVQCPGNQVTASTGATSVSACVCPTGTYGTNGSGVCTPCGQDQTSPQGTQTQTGCVIYCPAGKYASSASTCTMCPYGTSPAGSTRISACMCAPGTFLSSGTCVAQCPIGMYGDNGSRSCIQCPGNQTSAVGAVGVSQCICPEGFGGLSGSGVCTPCTGGQASIVGPYTCPDDTWTLTGSVCSKVSDYDCTGVSYDDIIESGQLLEPVEIDIGTTPPRAFTTQPVRNGTSFTFSLDINIEGKTPGVWRDIFQNISGVTWPITNSNMRKPSLHISDYWISFTYSTNPGGPLSDYNFATDSNYNVVPGTWFKCTCTVDGPNKTIAMYINGQKQSENTTSGTLAPPTGAPAFTWRPWNGNNNGYIKVKNVYWWNQVLSSDAIKLFAGLSVPGACYKTANTCYSTTYTCPTSACTLSRYTCPDATWTLNGSVCLKTGQAMTAATVTCNCPVRPAQYTCPSGWTLDGNRCRTTNPTYYSCQNGGSEYNRDTFTGWTTVKSAWKLEGTRCKRYTCSTNTSQSGTYLTIDGNSCKFYSSAYTCPPGYNNRLDLGSAAALSAGLNTCSSMNYDLTSTYGFIIRITRAVPYTLDITTTVDAGDDISATPQYDYRPADPVMSDQTVTGTLTRTQAQVMAIQTTSATYGTSSRQCMCSGTQYMDLLNKNCVTRCPPATYADSATKMCQPCPANKTSPEGSTSSSQCVCSYATPYWTGFSCMQELNPSAVLSGSGFTTRYENSYTIHEFMQSGSFVISSPIIANLLLVGGGAGGSNDGKPGLGGEVTYIPNSSLSSGTYNVTVGAGGGPNSYGECTYLYS
jgi:sugar lactone lactonase YvrE